MYSDIARGCELFDVQNIGTLRYVLGVIEI